MKEIKINTIEIKIFDKLKTGNYLYKKAIRFSFVSVNVIVIVTVMSQQIVNQL